MELLDVIGRLQGATQTGTDQWQAVCPAHDDRKASLGVAHGRNGGVVLRCLAGCDTEAVVGAMGLRMGDLMPDRKQPPSQTQAEGSGKKAKRCTEPITYIYHDAEGQPLFGIIRKPNKDFWVARFDGQGGWFYGLGGVKRVVYHLPEVLAAVTSGKVIYWPEGEKDVDNLRALGFTATTSANGADSFRLTAASTRKALKGARVVLLPDNDESGERYANDVAESLNGVAERIQVLRLEGLPDKGDVSDWIAAGGTREQLEALAQSAPEAEVSERPAGMPTIVVNGRQLRAVTDDVLDALVAANDPPILFTRAGQLVITRKVEEDRPVIQALDESGVRGRIARCMDTVRMTEEGPKAVPPPLDVVRDLRALGEWPFPELSAITEVPILRPDGTILDEPGYDPETRLIYHPTEQVPEVPEKPSAEDVASAVSLIDELIGDFPFDSAASRSNAFALLLTPIVRPALEGVVPAAVVDAPQAGTGKSLFTRMVSLIATGREAAMMTAPREDEEWSKCITSVLLSGATVFAIDNLEGQIRAPSLAAAITMDPWKGRVLGRSEMVELRQRVTWILNGNNVELGGDLPRRCYWVRLDAKQVRPWMRTGFRHSDLPGWAKTHRGEMLAALLTIARAWYIAGKPGADVPSIGGFGEWCTAVGGMLGYAGVVGFLGNLESLYERSDDSNREWEGFLDAIASVFGAREWTAGEIATSMEGNVRLRGALPGELSDSYGKGPSSFTRTLGRRLVKREGVRHNDDGLRFERSGQDSKGGRVIWKVVDDGSQVSGQLQVSFEKPAGETCGVQNGPGSGSSESVADYHISSSPLRVEKERGVPIYRGGGGLEPAKPGNLQNRSEDEDTSPF